MAVHDAVIAADKLRLKQGDTELRAPFSPPVSLSAAPGEDNVLFGGPGMCCIIICVPSSCGLVFLTSSPISAFIDPPGLAEQFFDLSSEDGAHLHLKSNL